MSNQRSLELVVPAGQERGLWALVFKPDRGKRVLLPIDFMKPGGTQEEILTEIEWRANGDWGASWVNAHGPGRFYGIEVSRYVMLRDDLTFESRGS